MSRLGLWESFSLRQHMSCVRDASGAVHFLQRACRACKLRGADSLVDLLAALLAVDPASESELVRWRAMHSGASNGSAAEYAAVTFLVAHEIASRDLRTSA